VEDTGEDIKLVILPSETANSKLIGKLGNDFRMSRDCPCVIFPLHRTSQYLPAFDGADGDEKIPPPYHT
jgi:hypothetical protein